MLNHCSYSHKVKQTVEFHHNRMLEVFLILILFASYLAQIRTNPKTCKKKVLDIKFNLMIQMSDQWCIFM